MNNPCYKCKERNPGCHSKCQDYIEWKKDQEKIKKARKNYLENNRR